jgi:hypothetical protein
MPARRRCVTSQQSEAANARKDGSVDDNVGRDPE